MATLAPVFCEHTKILGYQDPFQFSVLAENLRGREQGHPSQPWHTLLVGYKILSKNDCKLIKFTTHNDCQLLWSQAQIAAILRNLTKAYQKSLTHRWNQVSEPRLRAALENPAPTLESRISLIL